MPSRMPVDARVHPHNDDDNSSAHYTNPNIGSASSAAQAAAAPKLELSLTQILGSTGAAVTAAFLGSRLGVAGTLIGAALASVISVVGGTIYTNSIKATRRRMARVIVAVRKQDDTDRQHVGRSEFPVVRVRPPAFGDPAIEPSALGGGGSDAGRTATPRRTRRSRRPLIGGVLVGAVLSAAVFAGALALVTGYESVSGTPISGGQTGGLTILGGAREHTAPSTGTSSTTAPGSSSSATTTATSSTASPTTATPSTTANAVPPVSATVSVTSPTAAATTGSSTSGASSATTAPTGQSTVASTGTGSPASSADASASAPIGADSTTGTIPTATEPTVTDTPVTDGAVPTDPNSPR